MNNNENDTFEIQRRDGIEKAESILSNAKLRHSRSTSELLLKVPTRTSGDILADVWSAITVGTFCRLNNSVRVMTWGNANWNPEIESNQFALSLPGLVALQLAHQVTTDGPDRTPIERGSVERYVSLKKRGVVELGGGSTRALVEFDPQQPVALALQDDRSPLPVLEKRRMLFAQLLLSFRSELEIGTKRRGYVPQEAGAIKAFGTFLGELHDNAYEHGRSTVNPNSPGEGIRILRLRKHIARNKDEMLAKTGAFAPLHDYISQITHAGGQQAVIEAVVSDFGLGIVDHFLGSSQGQAHQKTPRRDLLDRLMFDRLSAKGSDPAAGLGISNALRAAKQLASFVSVRTNEFWLAQSYADASAGITLADVKKEKIAPVAGTHWQFILPQPV